MARQQADAMMMHRQELEIVDPRHLEFATKTPWKLGALIRGHNEVGSQDVVLARGFKQHIERSQWLTGKALGCPDSVVACATRPEN
jgi:hypothetical protein